MFILLICGGLFWIYGRQIVLEYGYQASDIPVHLSWINQMSRGKIFSDGVYPFGFHCMIYYIHMVFRMDTYVILCEFFFVQVIYLHVVLLAMLKSLCKTKYLPYTGVFIYIVGKILFHLTPGIWNDFCNSINLFSYQIFSDTKRTLAEKRNQKNFAMLCNGVCSYISNTFLWNNGCGALLHRYCHGLFLSLY